MQISCRDRNKIALQSDILGANALGIKNILCITGDSVKAGDQHDAKAVHEFESVRLLKQIQAVNNGIDPNITVFALKFASILINKYCEGDVVSQIYDVYPKKIENRKIEIDYNIVNQLIGQNIDTKRINENIIDLNPGENNN